VHVVADAGPVRGRVVVAEDAERRAVSGGPQGERHEVRLGIVVLAQTRVRAAGVEVAQCDRGDVGGDAAQQALGGELRLAVRVGGRQWVVLDDGDVPGIAVDGRCRREDQAVHTGGACRPEDRRCPGDVHLSVTLRMRYRLGDLGQRGHVHDRPGADAPQGCGQRLLVADVAADQGRTRGNGGGVPARKVVVDGDLVTLCRQARGDHAADVARTTCDEDAHRRGWYQAAAAARNGEGWRDRRRLRPPTATAPGGNGDGPPGGVPGGRRRGSSAAAGSRPLRRDRAARLSLSQSRCRRAPSTRGCAESSRTSAARPWSRTLGTHGPRP